MDTLLQVVLGRRLLGVFMTIYMPTILMNIVGHCTMYFKPFFFEAQVTVNLTTLLVMVTLFVNVSTLKLRFPKFLSYQDLTDYERNTFVISSHTFI